MRRKTRDPRLVALMDKKAMLQADCEKHYRRMRLAFNRLEKSRQALARLAKRIDAMETASNDV